MAEDEAVPVEAIVASVSIDGLSIESTSYTGNARVDIPNPDEDYASVRRRAVDHLTPHGVRPQTDAETEAERALTRQILKKAATNILQLDLSRISFPVAFSEHRSFLERLSDLFSPLIANYLDRVLFESDAEQRLQVFAVGVMACFHMDMSSKKPWNPLLGETYTCRWANGTTFYAEQISHHPAVSAVQLAGPGGAWTCNGRCSWRVDNGVQAVLVEQKGTFSLTLVDGTEFEWEFPPIQILGNVSGDRIVRIKGPFSVFDRTNDIECVVEIHPKKEKKRGTENAVATTVVGGIRTKKGDAPATITGDYCGKLLLNGDVLWDIEDPIVTRPAADIPDAELLRSDSRFRLDRNLFIQGRIEDADRIKSALEALQRKEEALRFGRLAEPVATQAAAPPPPAQPDETAPADPQAGKGVKGGFSAFKKFAGKQFAKFGKKEGD